MCNSLTFLLTLSVIDLRPTSKQTTTSATSLAIYSTLTFAAFLESAVATASLFALLCNKASKSLLDTLFAIASLSYST